jgi:hypothetical protein
MRAHPILLCVLLLSACRSESLPGPSRDGATGGRDFGVSCEGIPDPQTCQAAGCVADVCPSCSDTPERFVGCFPPGTHFTPCASCQNRPCEQHTTAEGCQASSACHAVYQPCPPTADCKAEYNFERCADGRAQCDKGTNGTCAFAPIICSGDFVLAYANGCEEGCVLKAECM